MQWQLLSGKGDGARAIVADVDGVVVTIKAAVTGDP
jgi:hypothetical protein